MTEMEDVRDGLLILLYFTISLMTMLSVLLPNPLYSRTEPTLLWEVSRTFFVVFATLPHAVLVWAALILFELNGLINRRGKRKTKTQIIEELNTKITTLKREVIMEKTKQKYNTDREMLYRVSVEFMKTKLCPSCRDQMKAQLEYIKSMEK